MSDDRVAEDQVNEAERGRQRSIEVDQQVKTLDHTKPKEKKIIAVCFYGRLMDCLFQAMSRSYKNCGKQKTKI